MKDEEIAEYLEGTCRSEHDAIQAFDLNCTPEDIIEIALDYNIERCGICGWWCESTELVDPDDESQEQSVCDQCRLKNKEI